jgi:hypothetical protein
MEMPSVFIASSGRAKELGTALRNKLVKGGCANADTWHIDTFHADGNTLRTLLKAAEQHDYAVVFLTKDDVGYKGTPAINEKPLNVPRDNCLFELGLFIAALGIKPRRCFFATSLSEESLPSDLRGETYCKILEPDDLSDTEKCAASVNGAYIEIETLVKRHGCYTERPTIPITRSSELLSLEDVHAKVNITNDSTVIIRSSHPLERNAAAALRVIENLKYGVCYRYFFDTQASKFVFIAAMLQSLAAVGTTDPKTWDGFNSVERARWVTDATRRTAIKEALERLAANVKIHFVPHEACEEFCIHDATNTPKGYLKWNDTSFLFLKREQTRSKSNVYERYEHTSDRVFGSTVHVNLDDLLRGGLDQGIQLKFPGMDDLMRAYFFPPPAASPEIRVVRQ